MTSFPTSIDILNRASTIATLVSLEQRANKSGQYNNDNGKNLIYFWDQIPIPQKGGAISLLLFSDLESMFFTFPLFNSYSIKFLYPQKKKS
jgi:hypothetical protein